METYEKKYKEAKDKVAARFGINVAKEIFTDLYESEDERIRKAIIDIIKSQKEQQCHIDSTIYDEMIARLEKQGNKTAWSDEDEVMLQACLDTLQAKSLMGKVDTTITMWLKSLKVRIGG